MHNYGDCAVIGLGNQKGGTTKSTSTVNLAAALGEFGRRVLIIDLDARTGATYALGVAPIYQGSCEVCLGIVPIVDAILKTDEDEDIYLPKNVDLLCGRENLFSLKEEAESRGVDPLAVLGEQLETAAKFYDYILIDTPPDASLPSIACYYVSRWYLIPSQPQEMSTQGVLEARKDLADAEKDLGSPVELLGVVINCMSGKKVNDEHRQVEVAGEGLPDNAGVFTPINRSVKVHQAQSKGLTILQEFPTHKVAEQFRQLAIEVEERLAERLNNQGEK